MKKAITFAIIATLSGAAAAFAQPHGGHGEERFAKLDTNKDGKVDKNELAAGMRVFFDKLDTNKDGKVDKSELAAKQEKWHGRGGHGGGFLARMDQNGDGAIDATELQAAVNKRFERMDANHDGAIEKDELAHGRFGRHECEHGKHFEGGAAGSRG